MVNANGGAPFPAGPSQPSTALALVLRTALWSGVSIALAAPAAANPKGGTVVAGSATISQPQANVTEIKQTTNSAAINWQSFGIAPSETTVFQQPSSSSITLNRVIGADPSVIAGHLVANGRLILVNQNGIAFSAGAQVDANALIATPADIKTGDFTAGRLVFNAASAKPGATVTNAGTITVADHGLAALVAPGVSNSGIINAKLGRVVLGGKESFAVDLYGDGMLSFDVGGKAGAAQAGAPAAMQVSNTGQINADGGRVLLTADTADSVVTGVVNLGGEINARAVGTETGQVIADAGRGGALVVSGRVDASGAGATGGTVKLLGDAVALRSGAQIDASGDAGGGTILVGGNFHGAGSEPNAKTILVEGGAFLRADARQSGDGGRIAVWSDLATTVAGTITAHGGSFGGNGGFVETSGRQHLDVAGARIDTSAAKGKSGTWLLDPVDITIDDNATSADLGTGPKFQSGGAQTASELKIGDLNAALVNNDVVIDTHLGGTGPLGGQITVNAASAVAWSGHALTLNADSAIDIKSAISGGSGSSLTLTAGTAITQSASVAAGTVSYRAKGGGVTLAANLASAGDLTVAANGLLSIGGAFGAGSGKTINFSGGGIALSGAVTTNATTLLDAKGQAYTDNGHLLSTTNHNLSLTAGRVALTAPGTSLDSGSAAMTLAASSGEGLSAGTAVGGTLALSDGTLGLLHTSAGLTLATTGAADDISVDHVSARANFGPLTVSAGRAVSFGGSGSSFAGDVTARAAGAVSGVGISLAGDIADSGHAVDLTASAGRIEQSAGTITAARLSGSSVGGARLADGNAVNSLGRFTNSGTGDVQIANAAPLSVTGPVDAGNGNSLTLTTTGAGSQLLLGDSMITAANGTVTLNSAAAIGQTAAGTITAARLGGNSVGGANLTGANTVDSLGNFTNAGVGDVQITNAQTLTVAGPVDAGSGNNLTLKTTGAGSQLRLGDSGVTAVNGAVTLISADAITETAAGTITAARLAGSSVGGADFGGANAVGTLTSFNNASSGTLSFRNGQALLADGMTGALASAGGVTITTIAGGLTVTGVINGGDTISLNGAGGIALSGAVTTNAATLLDAKGQAYTDNGHLLSTTNHNLSLTAGRVALTAAGTSLDSGSAAMTVAASAGEGLSAGTAVGGTLALSDGTLGLLHTSAGLTLATTGAADDISVDHLSAHANFGPLTVSAGRAVSFGASGSSFAGDVTARAAGAVSGVGIDLAGDIAASGHRVDLTASSGRVEQTAGTITAARLSGGSVGGASFADVNAIGTFGGFSNRSSGDVTLRNGQALIVDGTAGAVSSAGNITVTTTSGGLTLEGAIDAGGTVQLTAASGIALAADTTTNATTMLDTGGQTYTDNGHTLSTSGNPLFLATGRVNLTAPTVSLDSGGAALTITPPSGTGVSLGTLVAGTLNLSDTELGLIRAGTVTFQTSGVGADIAVDQVTAHAGFGGIALDAARNLSFGPGGSGFAGNVLGNAGDMALAGNLTAAGKTVTLHARGRIVQSAGGIAAGLLTGSTGGDAIFAGNNAVDLGTFTIGGPGNFLFNSGRALTINAPIVVPQGNLILSTTAGDLTLAADLTASGSAVVNVAGALRQTSGTISASSLIGSSIGGASLTDLNQIPLLLGFNNAGAGDVSIRDAGTPIVTGNYAAPGGNFSITASGALTLQGVAASAGNQIVLRSTGGFHLSGGHFSAGHGVILSTDGPFVETGLATFSTGYVAFDSTGAPLDLLQTFGPADPANSLIAFRTGTGNGAITLDTVSAPTATLLLSANSGAITAANIDVNRLAIAGSGGSASIVGTIHGTNGQGAADFAVKSGAQDNFYKVNDCAVSTTNCIVVPRIVPVTPPAYGNFAIIAPARQSDDSTLQAFSVGDEDLLQ